MKIPNLPTVIVFVAVCWFEVGSLSKGPTQKELDAALQSAMDTWHIKDVTLRMEPLGACDSTPGANAVLSRSEARSIVLNSNCDWNLFPIRKTVLHEAGRIALRTAR